MTAKPLHYAFEELKAWASDPRPRIGTGIPYLDNMMNGGLARSEYMMVTAFSGSGKTNFALNVCANNPHVPVVFYSLEMSARQVASRLAAMFTGSPTSQIEAQFKLEENPEFAAQVTANLPLFFIDDTPAITLRDAKESFRQVADQLAAVGHPAPRLAIFDYLELIGGAGLMGKAEQVDRASEKLRNFARELDISVIVLHQVSMGESEGPLSLTSGRYGGHAPTDVYIGLHRPGRVKDLPEHDRRMKKDQIIMQVLKNRTTGKEDYTGRIHHIDPVSMRIFEPNQSFRIPSPVGVQPALV